MPKAYILVGVPGSGKSTWISKQPFDRSNTIVASTDRYVEQVAKKEGKTYGEVFKAVMPRAVRHMVMTVRSAVKNKNDIVWDQTSTTVNTRLKKLRMLPDEYEKIAVVFPTPDKNELERRLSDRPGKEIPNDVMNQMINGWEEPTEAEGFDKIIYVS